MFQAPASETKLAMLVPFIGQMVERVDIKGDLGDKQQQGAEQQLQAAWGEFRFVCL
ncbi:MAG: hypothetical protein JMN27_11975 [gamma proteobacterium endosymbiont of Lamellibrachia anaximandri]|nr:hypothetical protein [gamma proteobacterium endosymbiont of Lamellibrachia anaximandri]MBL3534539.1 hypothetical protein [gamma proteobacterium endosymbiont of Lamellibrachia anaximandri]